MFRQKKNDRKMRRGGDKERRDGGLGHTDECFFFMRREKKSNAHAAYRGSQASTVASRLALPGRDGSPGTVTLPVERRQFTLACRPPLQA